MVVFDNGQKKIVIEENYVAYYNEGILFSKLYQDEPLKYSFYLIATVLALVNKAKKILILGTGLGTAIQQCKRLIPDAEVTAVDIDKEVFLLGKKFFGLSKYPDVNYVVEDAIKYVKQENANYDYIMIDLCTGSKIPRTFMEVEFLYDAYRRLNEKGILVYNSSMRDFGCFERLCHIDNPVKYIYKNMFLAGFEEVSKVDFGYSGWIYCTKSKKINSVSRINSIEHDSKYVMMAMEIYKSFAHRIYKNELMAKVKNDFEGSELMAAYRDYLLNFIMKIKRGNIPILYEEEGKQKIVELFFSY